MKFTIRTTYLNWFSLALIIALAVNFYVQFFRYTTNIPINDDYRAILEWLNNFKAASGFRERLTLLFSQSNEHRIVYDRLWTLVSYKIFGKVDFNFLSLIGNLSYLGIFFLLGWPLQKKGWLYVLPVAVLIFNFSFYENMTFAMATLSNNTGLLFALLSVYFAAKSEKHSYLSIVFYAMSVFTVGSGLFLTPLIPVILWHRSHKKTFWIFLALMAIALAVYFIGYQKPAQTPDVFETIGFFKFKAAMFFLSFLGGISSSYLIFTNDVNESLMLSGMLGLAMLLFYGRLVRKKYYRENLLVFSMMTFVLLTAALTALTRTQMGLETAIASRYRLYSAVMLIYCIYYFADHAKFAEKWREGIIMLFSVGYFFGISYKQTEYLDYREYLNYLGVVNYYSGNHKLLNGFEQDAYKPILEQAKYNQIYEFPSEDEVNAYFPFSEKVADRTQNTNTDQWFTHDPEQIFELKDSFLILGKGFIDKESTYGQKIYIELLDPATGQKLTFATMPVKRYDMNPYFKKYNLDYGGFCCRIKKDQLGNGEYAIGMSIENGNLFRRETTDKKIKKTF